MNKVIKWVLIAGGVIVALVIITLLVIPMFVDVQKYKPEIEKKVSEITGRPFTVGGDLKLSLFPWAGLSFSDLHMGNLPGYTEKDFLSVKSFELRVKLLPLLFRDLQVERFILEGPRIVMEQNEAGRRNWEGIGKPSAQVSTRPPKEKARPTEKKPREGLPIKALAVGEFAITKGSLLWIDHIKGVRREISDLTLQLQDISLDRPVKLAFSASLDGHPLTLEGNLGPLGKDLGKGTVPLDLSFKALKQVDISLKGNLVDAAARQQFELVLQVSPFSPRKLMASLDQTFPVTTRDPEVLKLVALKAKLKGDPKNVSVSNGVLDIDQSKMNFSAKAKDFSKPDLTFDLNLDDIDLDRYMPPPSEKKPAKKKKKTKVPPPEEKKTDYTPFRRLFLNGTIRVGKLTAHGMKIRDLYLKVSAKNGRFRLDPFTLKLYQGDVSAKGDLDVRQGIPKSHMDLETEGILVGPLLRDLMKKDFLEGTMEAKVAIGMAGDDAERIKKTLNGKGEFLFKDGAVRGIDLAGMVRNVKAAFGLAEKGRDRPRTDFSELHAPFTVTNGVVSTPRTSLKSPFLRVFASGKADLVQETLDFRVKPKFVGTLKGQGDMKQRAGIAVPVLVTGRFSSPKFRPDLRGMLKQKLEKAIPEPSELKKILKGRGTQKDKETPLEEKAKELLKGLPFGQ